MSNGLMEIFGMSEKYKSISNRAFGNTHSFYQGNFKNIHGAGSASVTQGHFQIDTTYGTLIKEQSISIHSKSQEISNITERFKSSDWILDIMEEENNPSYKWRIEQENERNYQKSKVTEPEVEEKSNLFPNMPGVESYKMKVKIRSINDFIPKSFD